MCQEFNLCFSSVFTREDARLVLPETERRLDIDSEEELLMLTSHKMVVKNIRKLLLNKAAGVDGLVSNIFIETVDIISLPLFLIFKSSLDSGIVPEDWKKVSDCTLQKRPEEQLR